MKIASTIARYLLGLIFLIFGANILFPFLKMPPMAGLPGQFMGALFMSHELVVIGLLELIPALLLLAGRYVPLALTLLGPVVLNILLFHAFMAPSGLPIALVAAVLWFLTAAGVWSSFRPLFAAKA